MALTGDFGQQQFPIFGTTIELNNDSAIFKTNIVPDNGIEKAHADQLFQSLDKIQRMYVSDKMIKNKLVEFLKHFKHQIGKVEAVIHYKKAYVFADIKVENLENETIGFTL